MRKGTMKWEKEWLIRSKISMKRNLYVFPEKFLGLICQGRHKMTYSARFTGKMYWYDVLYCFLSPLHQSNSLIPAISINLNKQEVKMKYTMQLVINFLVICSREIKWFSFQESLAKKDKFALEEIMKAPAKSQGSDSTSCREK